MILNFYNPGIQIGTCSDKLINACIDFFRTGRILFTEFFNLIRKLCNLFKGFHVVIGKPDQLLGVKAHGFCDLKKPFPQVVLSDRVE